MATEEKVKTETAHSPGPWHIGNRYGRSRTEIAVPGKALATVWTHRAETDPHKNHRDDVPDEEGIANLNLIAAAPDLFEACRYIVDAAENGDEMTAIDMASAALAKARGEEP